ncbi:MAG: 16S rRNA (cytosine(1402)-N(4))-methyltransferase RsmH [Microbacteriaceae bacterium]|nr:16S rRNA (cytosine(1402)-N(4))-methyltransferase RsmH [Microbacteriaceae bacterium]
MTTPTHTPVLLDECLDVLEPVLSGTGAVVIDGTLGLGGHSEAILRRFPDATVVGIDRDTVALRLASERLASFGSRFIGVHTTYDHIADALATTERSTANGILLDLGISSMQIDESERGFAYAMDAPLDMRMDQSTGDTAADILRDYDEGDLIRIFREFGEEKLAPRYARAIVAERRENPILRSEHLVRILNDATPYALKNAGHPAKRVFQALRIEVNGELSILRGAIDNALSALAVGGRLLVLSYHSLEDRIVKVAFAAASTSSAPHSLPVVPLALRAGYRLVFSGARKASAEEIARNSRAASVKFRAIERLDTAA